MQYAQHNFDLTGNYQSHIYTLINAEIKKLNRNQLFLVYNMLRILQQPIETKGSVFSSGVCFTKSQQALAGISGNLSDDIINTDRNERII